MILKIKKQILVDQYIIRLSSFNLSWNTDSAEESTLVIESILTHTDVHIRGVMKKYQDWVLRFLIQNLEDVITTG